MVTGYGPPRVLFTILAMVPPSKSLKGSENPSEGAVQIAARLPESARQILKSSGSYRFPVACRICRARQWTGQDLDRRSGRNVHSGNPGSDRQTVDRNPRSRCVGTRIQAPNNWGVIQRSSASRMSCSNNAPRPRSVIARPPGPFGVTKPNVRSLRAISIGIGDGSRFASVAACILRSQSKSSGVRFGFVALILSNLLRFARQYVDRPRTDSRIPR